MYRLICWLCLVGLGLGTSLSGVWAQQAEPFVDYGIGARAAEARGVVTTRTADGRSLVIGVAADQGPKAYLVVTDIDSGVSEQVYFPEGISKSDTFGSLMASNGRFYTGLGSTLLEYDPQTSEWLWHGRPAPGPYYMAFYEAPDGLIWAAGLGSHLVSYNPDTQEAKYHGQLDPAEQYMMSLASDDQGWVYAGIGTSRQNIVGYHIASGRVVPLADEADRVHGTATVKATQDGKVVATINQKLFALHGGQATPIAADQVADATPTGKVYYGQIHKNFPDGRKIVTYSMPDKTMTVQDPEAGTTRKITLSYEAGGLNITNLGAGPGGTIYGSTSHPMHFIRLTTATGELEDLGAVPRIGGGNMCSITSQGQYVMGAVYANGSMWLFDTAKPFNPEGKRKDLALSAAALMEEGEFKNGHFTYLDNYAAAFFCGDEFGAEGSFKLTVPADGEYYLHLIYLQSMNYCRVQFKLDGQPLGEPLDASAPDTTTGPIQVFGPLTLTAGEHAFTTTLLETPDRKPWFSICSMELSPEKLADPNVGQVVNPTMVVSWPSEICRPRAALAHPDGQHLLMSGYAGYGLVGGGIGIYNVETQESQLLPPEELLPGHSCIALQALPGGDLVGGTDIAAPGGGHPIAKEAQLFIINWAERKVVFNTVPVPDHTAIISLAVGPEGFVYGLTNKATLFVFDPTNRQVVHTAPIPDLASPARHGLHTAPDGNIYALLARGIVQITPGSYETKLLATPPETISGGGVLHEGRLYYVSNTKVWSYQIPGLQ
jgi:hypothetical protein